MQKENLAESNDPVREAYVYVPKKRPKKREKKPAGKHERTPQKLISQMIDKYVDGEERRAQFLRDAVQVLDEYRVRGLRATSREVIAWLEAWDDEDDSEGPSCHR